jgi:hypothetical protein
MELKNDLDRGAVDKILEALAPALSTELEKVLLEARQRQEEDFRKRLETAVREGAAAAKSLAEDEKRQALTAAEEKLTAELQNQFQRTLRDTTDKLKAELDQQSQAATTQWNNERARLQDQINLWRTYAEAQRRLAESSSQAEMLTRFLNLVEPFAGAVAVYVAKADGLALWKSRGKGAFPDVVSKNTIDPEAFFKAVVIRDRTVAAVSAIAPFEAEPLDFLSTCLGRAIEMFGMNLKTPVPKAVPAVPVKPGPAAPKSPGPVAAASAAPPESDEKLGAEARLAARLLVSEIKLYNENDVRDGRASMDLYTRLQKQIDQGRDQYRQRLDAAGGSVSRDYYHEELVRVLADGEASRLGPNYPGSSH